SHGATVGILIAIYLYSKKATNQSYMYVLDRLVITIAFAGCLIRLGNLMNSEIVGLPTNFPTDFVFVSETETGLEDAFHKVIRDVEIIDNPKDTAIEGFKYDAIDIIATVKPGDFSKEELLKDIKTTL